MIEPSNDDINPDSILAGKEIKHAIDFGGTDEENLNENQTDRKSGLEKKPSDFPSFRIQMDEEFF